MTAKKRRWPWILLGILTLAITVLYPRWREASRQGGQKPAEPFRIAGNFYYVGANDATSFLLTGPEGHILIDGGYPGTPPLIMASISKLGFNIADVKILLNSHAHSDHAGGLAELQQTSGAEMWVSEGDAEALATGRSESRFLGPFGFLSYLPFLQYTPPRVDQKFSDGDTIRLGPIELIAHITGGHTRGNTTWLIPVHEGERQLNIVHVGSLVPPPALSLGEYPEIRAEFETAFRRLRSLQADIFVTPHARDFGRWRKYQQSLKVEDPFAAFIDPDGYHSHIDGAEARYRRTISDD